MVNTEIDDEAETKRFLDFNRDNKCLLMADEHGQSQSFPQFLILEDMQVESGSARGGSSLSSKRLVPSSWRVGASRMHKKRKNFDYLNYNEFNDKIHEGRMSHANKRRLEKLSESESLQRSRSLSNQKKKHFVRMPSMEVVRPSLHHGDDHETHVGCAAAEKGRFQTQRIRKSLEKLNFYQRQFDRLMQGEGVVPDGRKVSVDPKRAYQKTLQELSQIQRKHSSQQQNAGVRARSESLERAQEMKALIGEVSLRLRGTYLDAVEAKMIKANQKRTAVILPTTSWLKANGEIKSIHLRLHHQKVSASRERPQSPARGLKLPLLPKQGAAGASARGSPGSMMDAGEIQFKISRAVSILNNAKVKGQQHLRRSCTDLAAAAKAPVVKKCVHRLKHSQVLDPKAIQEEDLTDSFHSSHFSGFAKSVNVQAIFDRQYDPQLYREHQKKMRARYLKRVHQSQEKQFEKMKNKVKKEAKPLFG